MNPLISMISVADPKNGPERGARQRRRSQRRRSIRRWRVGLGNLCAALRRAFFAVLGGCAAALLPSP
jgi:hypothetical protein